MKRLLLITALLLTMQSPVHAQTPPTFTNPIAQRGQDPWVVAHDNRFYYCYARGNGIGLREAEHLEQIGDGEETIVWQAPPNTMYSREIWAPELHRIGDRWYIYFAADDGNNHHHRMYVLKSEGDNPLGPYTFAGKITDATDKWAIDGTVYEHHDGRLFFIWSGWPGDVNEVQNLYIAPMSNALTIDGPRVLISTPEHDWERIGDPKVNEGPQVLKRNGKTHVIYSASGSWTDDYCLGRLTLTGDDPLDPTAWQKHPEPVFRKTDKVYAPGHASFVHIKNEQSGNNWWIVYHSARHPGAGWDRVVNLQPFTWDDNSNPVFGRPTDPGTTIISPRAETK